MSRRLAELTGAEWGIVTAGAAASLFQATAASIAGADPELMIRLPNTEGLKDRVITWKGGRYTFDHAVRMAGARIVEVETREELIAALDERAAMFLIRASQEKQGPLCLEEIAEITRPRGIPITIDGAGHHLVLPNPYLTRGATMIAYSGGKYFRGPQCTGLLLGDKKWIRAAWRNASPHHTLGRAIKVGKEEIVGLLAAVEHWAAVRDPEAELRQWEADLATIADEIGKVPTVETEVIQAGVPFMPVPRLRVRWDGNRIGLTGLELRERLLEGEPRIMLDDRRATDSSLFILPYSLQPGQASAVASRLREALANAPMRSLSKPDPPAVKITGVWQMDVEFVKGTSAHEVVLEQQRGELTGLHRTRFLENPLSGSVRGNEVTFRSWQPLEGINLSYCFTGTVDGDTMEGLVELGNSSSSTPGPLNQQEFGHARWQARRKDGT